MLGNNKGATSLSNGAMSPGRECHHATIGIQCEWAIISNSRPLTSRRSFGSVQADDHRMHLANGCLILWCTGKSARV